MSIDPSTMSAASSSDDSSGSDDRSSSDDSSPDASSSDDSSSSDVSSSADDSSSDSSSSDESSSDDSSSSDDDSSSDDSASDDSSSDDSSSDDSSSDDSSSDDSSSDDNASDDSSSDDSSSDNSSSDDSSSSDDGSSSSDGTGADTPLDSGAVAMARTNADLNHANALVAVVWLKIRLRDAADNPRPNVPYTLTVSGQAVTGQTDAQGTLSERVGFDKSDGTLEIDGQQIAIKMYQLPDISQVQGVQARLANLHYYAGPIDGQLSQDTQDAITRFQMDMTAQGTALDVTGQIDDATTAALKAQHLS